jgi:hypothetical protein
MESVILALVLLGAVIVWLRRRRRPLRSRTSALVRRSPKSDTANGVPSRLMNQLHRLTRDRRVSERLIERIAFNNPGRSRRWCVEKAIYDIQRDRRA